MLVLSRRREESVMIGDDVEVKIISIHGNEVQLGIEAPKQVPVHRREEYEGICAERSCNIGYPFFYARQREEITADV